MKIVILDNTSQINHHYHHTVSYYSFEGLKFDISLLFQGRLIQQLSQLMIQQSSSDHSQPSCQNQFNNRLSKAYHQSDYAKKRKQFRNSIQQQKFGSFQLYSTSRNPGFGINNFYSTQITNRLNKSPQKKAGRFQTSFYSNRGYNNKTQHQNKKDKNKNEKKRKNQRKSQKKSYKKNIFLDQEKQQEISALTNKEEDHQQKNEEIQTKIMIAGDEVKNKKNSLTGGKQSNNQNIKKKNDEINDRIERAYSPKKPRQKRRQPIPPPKQPDDEQKKHREMIKYLFQKCEQVWVFYIKNLTQYYEMKLKNLYKGISSDKNCEQMHTVCFKKWELDNFFRIDGDSQCKVNLVVSYEFEQDIPFYEKFNNSATSNRDKFNKIIIYHPDENLLTKHRLSKNNPSQRREITQFQSNFDQIIQIADAYIDIFRPFWQIPTQLDSMVNQNRKVDQYVFRKNQKFVTYLKVNKYNKEKFAKYRNCLYSAKNLDPFEFKKYLSDFQSYSTVFIEKNYKNKEMRNKYNLLKSNYTEDMVHDGIFDIEKPSNLHKIIQYYLMESYFYHALNSKLRTFDSFSELRKCCLPFYELYHAIQLYYLQAKKNQQQDDLIVYRGCIMDQRQYDLLRKGDYIETTGFLSASKNIQKALEFCSSDTDCKYLIRIVIPAKKYSEQASKYDGGGYVDIEEDLSGVDIKKRNQSEVLFNCLNIFQVTEKKQQELYSDLQNTNYFYKVIELKYGAAMDLHDSQSKTRQQFEIWKFIKKLKDHEHNSDQGDMYIENKSYIQAIDFYKNAIQTYKKTAKLHEKKKQKEKIASYTYKLSESYRKNKQLQEAQKQLEQFINEEENIDFADRDQALKFYAFHMKSIQIKMENFRQDQAQIQINQTLDRLQNSVEQKFNLLMKRAQLRFRKGRVKEAESDFNRIELELKQMIKKIDDKQKQIENRHYWETMRLKFTFQSNQDNLQDLKKKKDQQLNAIMGQKDKVYQLIEQQTQRCKWMSEKMKQNANKYDLKLSEYMRYVEKGYGYIERLRARMADDPREKMKFAVMKAEIDNYNDKADSEEILKTVQNFMRQNKQSISKQSKIHYHELMAKIQQKQLNLPLKKNIVFSQNKDRYSIAMPQIYKKNFEIIYNQILENYSQALFLLKDFDIPQQTIKIQIGLSQIRQKFKENMKDQFERILNLKKQKEHLNIQEVANLMILLAEMAIEKGQIRFAYDQVRFAYLKMMNVIKTELKHQVLVSEDLIINKYEETEQYKKIQLLECRILIRQNKFQEFSKIHMRLRKLEQKLRATDRYANLNKNMVQIERLRGRMSYKQKNLIKTQIHYKNVVKMVQQQIHDEYYQLGKVYCQMSRYFFAEGDFIFGMKYMKKAEKSQIKARIEHPDTWPLYYLFYIHRKYQEKITRPNDRETISFLRSSALQYITIAHRLCSLTLDPLNIKRFQIRAGLFCCLMENRVFQNAFNEYTCLFDDLTREISKSYGYKKIEKHEDDEKVLFLKKIIQVFMKECEKCSFDLYLDADVRDQWYSKSKQKKNNMDQMTFISLL